LSVSGIEDESRGPSYEYAFKRNRMSFTQSAIRAVMTNLPIVFRSPNKQKLRTQPQLVAIFKQSPFGSAEPQPNS